MQLIAAALSQNDLCWFSITFEDNPALGGEGFLGLATAGVMQLLYCSAQRGKILFTSRYPLPDAGEWLKSLELGPLSSAQTGKLMLRLSALGAQEPEGIRLIQRAIGGHPRMLEYLDAILSKGKPACPMSLAALTSRPGEMASTLLRKNSCNF